MGIILWRMMSMAIRDVWEFKATSSFSRSSGMVSHIFLVDKANLACGTNMLAIEFLRMLMEMS